MATTLRRAAAVGVFTAALGAAAPTLAQKQEGVLKIHHCDSPPSLSILEEVRISTVLPMMGVFNNLVLYKRTNRKIASNRLSLSLLPSGPGARTGPG
jgi:hypothetical protein